MLQMMPECERCGHDLPPTQAGAYICSFECTFCEKCADGMGNICPNCSGNLSPRPTRARQHLEKHPPSLERKYKGLR